MLVIKAQKLLVEFGQRTLFSIDELELHSGDRVGLVGRNGEGKTTLLNVLSGFAEPTTGMVQTLAPVAVIPQFADDTDTTGVLARQRELWGIPEQAMSGGEKTRLLIARALGRESGALFCDEPTSNLDAEGVERLEQELLQYEGALVVVSHDRALLDKLCDRMWELEDGKLTVYRGNWTAYRQQKEHKRQRAWQEYEQYVDQRDHLTEAVRGAMQKSKSVRKAPKRMGNSEARLHRREATEISQKLARSAHTIETRLEKLERKDKPREDARVRMAGSAADGPGGRVALRVEDLRFAYPDGPQVLRGVSFEVPTGARLAVTGPNGAGKTTLLNCIARGDTGVRPAPAVRLAYFRQDLALLRDDHTVLENVMDGAAVPVQTARNMLARVLLPAEAAAKQAGVLSGGERAKATLVKLLASQANLLLLDEPTNFLDVYALEGLEDLMEQFPGTVLFVSHDRYFTERVATGVLRLVNGRLRDERNQPKPTMTLSDGERLQLTLRRDMLLSRVSTMGDGAERDAMLAEYQALTERLKQGGRG